MSRPDSPSTSPSKATASAPAEGGYRVDNSRWPLSLHRMPKAMGEADVSVMISSIDELLRRREPFSMVVDFDDELELAPTLRRKLAQLLVERNDLLERYCRGAAIVVRTPNARGVHTALRWLVPAPHAEQTFNLPREAEQWASLRMKSV